MLRWIVFFVLFSSVSVSAQEVTISGVVRDIDGQPVPKVKCQFLHHSQLKTISKNDGSFKIELKEPVYDTLRFEAFGFDQYDLVLTPKSYKKTRKTGEMKVDITLPDKTLGIIEYVYRPELPDTFFGSPDYSVEDFAFHSSGKVILLTYEKNLKSGGALRLLDENNEVIDQYFLDVTDPAIKLSTDFRGNVHLITEKNVYFITVTGNRLSVYFEYRDYYFRYVEPVIDTIGQNIYFSNYSELYPAFDYFQFNIPDSAYSTLISVKDEETMEFYRAEFKYLDNRTKVDLHNRELETGIDKEIWAGAMFYTNSIYYDPLYAPLFKVDDDSLLIFDHYKNLMFKYTPDAGFTDSVRISYHRDAKKSGWEQPLIQDQANGKIYAIFMESGFTFLREIDRNTGQVLASFKLYYKYIERIQIIDDQIYYIYRPFESVQKKYIYRESLKT